MIRQTDRQKATITPERLTNYMRVCLTHALNLIPNATLPTQNVRPTDHDILTLSRENGENECFVTEKLKPRTADEHDPIL